MSKYCIACYNTPEDCTCYPNRKPKDNQGDWEERWHKLWREDESANSPMGVDSANKAMMFNRFKAVDFIRELLKKQREEIIVKAEGYRNTYDALGKFIEDLSNS